VRITAGRLLTLADQAATFLFAVEGALAAVLAGIAGPVVRVLPELISEVNVQHAGHAPPPGRRDAAR
jgi:hypothetical protein